MSILQGNEYYLSFKITDNNSVVVNGALVDNATFTIGSITKSNEDVKFNTDTQLWEVYLKEEETFALSVGMMNWQARFIFKDGTIDGTDINVDYVKRSINKVRLSGGNENA